MLQLLNFYFLITKLKESVVTPPRHIFNPTYSRWTPTVLDPIVNRGYFVTVEERGDSFDVNMKENTKVMKSKLLVFKFHRENKSHHISREFGEFQRYTSLVHEKNQNFQPIWTIFSNFIKRVWESFKRNRDKQLQRNKIVFCHITTFSKENTPIFVHCVTFYLLIHGFQ